MLKNFFQSFNSQIAPEERNGAASHVVEQPEIVSAPAVNESAPPPPPSDSFESVYQNAAMKPPTLKYGILKVVEMVASSHLAGMSAELKRNSILMALEAAGAEIDYLLEDAVFRQRALNERDEVLQEKLRDFELIKSNEVLKIQAELEQLTAQYMARVQANLDEVAREQDSLRAWQRRKQQECQRIAESAMLCVPGGSHAAIGGFPNQMERGAVAATWR